MIYKSRFESVLATPSLRILSFYELWRLCYRVTRRLCVHSLPYLLALEVGGVGKGTSSWTDFDLSPESNSSLSPICLPFWVRDSLVVVFNARNAILLDKKNGLGCYTKRDYSPISNGDVQMSNVPFRRGTVRALVFVLFLVNVFNSSIYGSQF